MPNIKYSNKAQIDLDEAISHIAKDSISKALNYLKNYEDKIELLKFNPHMGVECKNKLIKRDCRILIYKSHIIIYKIDSKIDEIVIIRIYHGSVDYANKFNSDS
jgi:plasmid stabilization system protein ParE